jgi:Protein of unknown function (DUF1570)
MRNRILALALVATLGLATTVSSVLGQDAKSLGQQKVYRVQGPPVEGEVFDIGDAYEVVIRKGLKVKISKTEVRKLEPIAAAEPKTAGGGASGSARMPITPEIVQEILGSENVEIGSLDEEDLSVVDVMPPLTTDEVSAADMMRIAGPTAKRLETDHFIFVYTSELEIARSMAAKLERIYRWVNIFNNNMGIKSTRPPHRLEIFFFGTHAEYQSYQAINGFIMMGAIGFYMQTNNRSAFFDMNTWPPIAEQLKELRQPGINGEERRRRENRLNRMVKRTNAEVVQHEAAHHIHFNLGTLSRMGQAPRWVSEGMATMFETVESDSGASLGSLNHERLYQWRVLFGPRGERVPDMRTVILIDGWFFANGGNAYPMGWAINQYLLNKHRDKFKKWMQLNSARESFRIQTLTERQKQFEELFGEVDEEWTAKFVEYINSLQLIREGGEDGP